MGVKYTTGNPPPPPLPLQPCSTANTGSNPDRRCSKLTPSECFCLLATILFSAAVICFLTLHIKSLLPPSIKFLVNDISVPPFNISGSPLITSNWTIHFTVANPNPSNKTINYEWAAASLFYHYRHYISYGDISPFSLSGKDETVVVAELKGLSAHVNDKVSKSLTRDMTSLGAVEFQVHVNGIARVLGPETDKEVFYTLEVCCDHTKIVFVSNSTTVLGRLLGGSRKCIVHMR